MTKPKFKDKLKKITTSFEPTDSIYGYNTTRITGNAKNHIISKAIKRDYHG